MSFKTTLFAAIDAAVMLSFNGHPVEARENDAQSLILGNSCDEFLAVVKDQPITIDIEGVSTVTLCSSEDYPDLVTPTAKGTAQMMFRSYRPLQIEDMASDNSTSQPGAAPASDLTPEEQEADENLALEEKITAFMADRIENGQLDLEDIPLRLARYGLQHRQSFIDEMNERMAMAENAEG